jgi:biopolymer transport protein ExbD
MLEFGEHLPERKALDLTPMLDVVFLLLIFFMLTSTFAKPMLPLDLPEATSGAVTDENGVTVSLQRNGMTFIDGREIGLEQLSEELQVIFSQNSKRAFNLQADEGVVFGRVVTIMDMAQTAGAQSISVVTEEK